MVNSKLKKIGVFTSGGDSPGMNACIRSVVRTAIYHGIQVVGISHGYQGMIDGEFENLESFSVGNIIQRGGTILKSSRSEEFRTIEGRKKAADNLIENEIDGLIAIGGDGTFTGASVFWKEHQIPIIGIPGTIDNDLYGTDYTIGYDTAINTVVEAVDKIRDTADAHNRLFFVEVMGKDAGFIALRSGICVGAEAILVPETETYIDKLIEKLRRGWDRKKSSSIIIVAEGDDGGGAYKVAEAVKAKFNQYETKVTVLGHIQRGGSPSAADRVLASQLGYSGVLSLRDGKSNSMVGLVNKEVVLTSFEKAIKHHQKLNQELLKLADILSI